MQSMCENHDNIGTKALPLHTFVLWFKFIHIDTINHPSQYPMHYSLSIGSITTVVYGLKKSSLSLGVITYGTIRKLNKRQISHWPLYVMYKNAIGMHSGRLHHIQLDPEMDNCKLSFWDDVAVPGHLQAKMVILHASWLWLPICSCLLNLFTSVWARQ